MAVSTSALSRVREGARGAVRTPPLLVLAIVLLLPLKAVAPFGINSATPGLLLTVALVPVVITSIRRYRFGVLLPAAMVLCGVSGLLLSEFARSARSLDGSTRVSVTLFLLNAVVVLVTLLWARQEVGVRRTVLCYALGVTADAYLTPESWSTNAWKFAFAWPLTVVALAVIQRRGRWITALVLLGAAAFSATQGYRSFIAFCVVTLGVFLWRFSRTDSSSHRRLVFVFVVAIAAGVVMYRLETYLALQGYLGERNQVVTAQQAEGGRGPLLSGRPEWTAALALLRDKPMGYGPGTIPTAEDVQLGRAGLAAVGADINSAYVNSYLFGNRLELHSVYADFWVNFGLVGLATAVLMLSLLIRGALRLLTARGPHALEIFLILNALWDIVFSPMASNLPRVLLALAVTIPTAGRVRRPTRSVLVTLDVRGGTRRRSPPHRGQRAHLETRHRIGSESTAALP